RTWSVLSFSCARTRRITSPATPLSSTAGGCFSDVHHLDARRQPARVSAQALADDVRSCGDRWKPGAHLCTGAGHRLASSDRPRACGSARHPLADDLEHHAACLRLSPGPPTLFS